MKKHLIAAAVAAAVAVPAMAQVTVSGQYGVGYGKGLTSAQGLQVTDGNITFGASEDLGAGMKVAASLELRVRGRGAVNNTGTTAPTSTVSQDIGIGGRNASVSVSGGFGSVSAGSIEFANGIYGRGSAGAPIALQNQLNEKSLVLSGESNSDFLRYDTPAIFPGLTLAASYADGVGDGRTSSGVTGDTAANRNNYSLTGGVFYKTGPIDAAFEYSSFKQATDATSRTRLRTSASYNLGIARIGAGYETRETNADKTLDYAEYVVGISVPMGAITLGATYLSNETSGNSAIGLGAQYALSKRSSLNFSVAEKSGVAAHPLAATASATAGTQYRVRMLHTF